jgi:hypothetical protein
MARPAATKVLLIAATALVLTAGAVLGAGKRNPAKPGPADPPMRIYLVKSAESGCEPNCPEWIAAQGKILPGTVAQFKKVLAQLGDRRPPVLLHSGGGVADEAIAMGRLLRSKGLDVAVAQTSYKPCPPEKAGCKRDPKSPLRATVDPGIAICASACTFVLAAGKRRFVHKPAFVGVHRGDMILRRILHTYRLVPYRTGDGSVRVQRELIGEKVVSERHMEAPKKIYDSYDRYFLDMGITKVLMPLIMATPNDSVHWLTDQELRTTGMATHHMSAEKLVHHASEAEDGWGVPATGAVPAAPSGAAPGVPSSECTAKGVNCQWQTTPNAPAKKPEQR